MKTDEQVLILTEGGKGIGFGHVARCIALYQAFIERGITSKVCIHGDDTVCQLFGEQQYSFFTWGKDDQAILKLAKGFNIVLIDSYLALPEFYKVLSGLTPCAVFLDDNIRIEYPKGLIVNGAIYGRELHYPQNNGLIFLLGSSFMLLRKEFWDVAKKEVNDSIEEIIVTFGGDDMRDLTPSVLKLLVDRFPEIKKKVIIGRGFQNTNRIQNAADSLTELIYLPNAEEIKNIMINADMAISAAGQTLGELARVGVPTIAIGVADNQLNNINGWSKASFIEYVGWHDDDHLMEKLFACITRLRSKEIRSSKSSIGQGLVDGLGSLRIVDNILCQVRQ